MNKLLAVLAALSLSTTALSLGETNCSDAKGDLKLVENERWGANDISWYYNGEQITVDGPVKVEMIPRTRVQVLGSRENGQFLIDVKVEFNDAREPVTKKVFCETWSNSAID